MSSKKKDCSEQMKCFSYAKQYQCKAILQDNVKTSIGYKKLIREFYEKKEKVFCKTMKMDGKLRFAVRYFEPCTHT